MKKINSNISKKLCFIAILHWLITFATDRIFFEYSLFSFEDGKSAILSFYSWAVKLGFLCVLLLLYQVLGRVVQRVEEKNSVTRKRLWYAGIYFAGMVVLLFLVYPGAWRMDEFGILRDAKSLMPTFWQGYLTSVFYIFSLMLIPTPAGVVAVQCAVNAICMGYICEKAEKILGFRHKIWMFLPFLAFPVLDSNMYPMRMSVYAFLELLLAVVFLSAIWEKRKFTKGEFVLVICLTALCSVWRTEGIYYCLWIPLVFLAVFWKKEDRKNKLWFVATTIVTTIVVMLPQTIGNKMISGDQYEITSMVLPIAPLLVEAEQNQDTKLITAIDEVLDTELMIQGYQQGKSGINIFWSEPELIQKDYSTQEYSEFKSAYYQLIFKYPAVFFQERIETFLGSNGVLMDTTDLFESQDVANYAEFRENYKGVHGISAKLRAAVLSILEVRSLEDYNQKGTTFFIIWSFLPQLVALIVAAILLLVKKQWSSLLVVLGVLAKVPLIFMTAPSLLFMYYYGIYLIGNVVFIYGICFAVKTIKKSLKAER